MSKQPLSFLDRITSQRTEHYQFIPPAGSDVNTVDRYRSTVLPGQDKLYPKIAKFLWPTEPFLGDQQYNNFDDTR